MRKALRLLAIGMLLLCELAVMRSGAKFGMDWYRCPYCGGYHLTSKNSMKGTGK